MKKVMSKYDYHWTPRKIDESTDTVPDLVLSMAEIYRKYAVTGDISSLPGKVRPVTFDDGDEFEDTFDSEEMTDSLLHARELRERSRQPEQANPALEDNPQDNSDAQSASTKPQDQSHESSDHNEDAERSEKDE